MITALRQRMLQDLQLAGLGERTQEAYLRAYLHLTAVSQEQAVLQSIMVELQSIMVRRI